MNSDKINAMRTKIKSKVANRFIFVVFTVAAVTVLSGLFQVWDHTIPVFFTFLGFSLGVAVGVVGAIKLIVALKLDEQLNDLARQSIQEHFSHPTSMPAPSVPLAPSKQPEE